MAIVKVAFKTALQKFPVDAEVSEQDDLSPHTFDSLKAGGFIGEKTETKAASIGFKRPPVAAALPAEE